jgi:O-antigen ligase
METLYWLLGFLLPTQLGKYFFFENTYVGGLPIDFLSLKFFAVEIVILMLYSCFLFLGRVAYKKIHLISFTFISLFLLISSSTSSVTLWSLVSWVVVILFCFLVIDANGSEINKLKEGLALMGLIELFLSSYQFLLGKNLGGLAYWVGERTVSVSTANTATVELMNIERLRAYGSFSHPNSLAGFGLVAFWILWSKEQKITSFRNLAALAWLACVILTFSRSAALAFVLSLLVVAFKIRFKWLLLCSVTIAALLMILANINIKTGEHSVDERLIHIRASSLIIASRPIFGTGLGNFIPSAFEASKEYAFRYSYQPVHNSLILMLSELGIVGTAVIFILSYFLFRRAQSGVYAGAISSVLVTGSFDHYWFTLVQNRLLLAMVLCLLLRDNRKRIWKTVKKLQ